MLHIIRRFFMVLGVLFFIQLVGLGYLVVADPFNLRPLAVMLWQASGTKTAAVDTGSSIPATETTLQGTSTEPVDPPADKTSEVAVPAAVQPTLVNSAQAKALQSVGVDASAIENITPAQESCFVGILGAARVGAIKAGAVPTATEFFSVRGCL
jgi:hypothetical protein